MACILKLSWASACALTYIGQSFDLRAYQSSLKAMQTDAVVRYTSHLQPSIALSYKEGSCIDLITISTSAAVPSEKPISILCLKVVELLHSAFNTVEDFFLSVRASVWLNALPNYTNDPYESQTYGLLITKHAFFFTTERQCLEVARISICDVIILQGFAV